MSAREATIEDFAACYSDMFKDAYGYRPRGEMPQLTLEGWQAEFAYLERVIERNEADEREAAAYAVDALDARLESLMATTTRDRATVLRWLMEADNVDFTCPQSVAHWYYCQRIDFPTIRMALIHDHGFSRRAAYMHA